MATIDEQLVRRIAEQVIAQLNGGAPSAPPASPAPIRAPAGVCTGDYAKFTDRPDLVRVPSASGGGAKPPAAADASGDAPLTGFVTARHVDAVAGPVLPLAFGAKLTPLARDRAKERGLTVRRVSADRKPSPKATVWHWWIAGQCRAVDGVTAMLRAALTPLPAKRELSQLHRVVADLAQRIRTGRAAGGVLFVPSAARAICYANRCPSLRASVATCGEAVEQSIAELAANVLVVEYPHHGEKSMHAMVERFVTADRKALPRVEAQLKELASCG